MRKILAIGHGTQNLSFSFSVFPGTKMTMLNHRIRCIFWMTFPLDLKCIPVDFKYSVPMQEQNIICANSDN